MSFLTINDQIIKINHVVGLQTSFKKNLIKEICHLYQIRYQKRLYFYQKKTIKGRHFCQI